MALSSKNIEKIVYECGQLRKSETVVVLHDQKTTKIAQKILKCIGKNCKKYTLIEANIKIHGSEPSEEIAKSMLDADLIFGLTSYSIAHTVARKASSDSGARYLSLPDYTDTVVNSPAFGADFFEINKLCEKVCLFLSNKKNIKIETELGTSITMNITERQWNNASGILLSPGSLGSPPDSEINIAPIEFDTNGVIFVDGSIPIPEIGLLQNGEPEVLTVCDGFAVPTSGKFSTLLSGIFGDNPKNRIIGEFGIGFNPYAELCGRMLEDEGTMGTCHFGIGSNSTIGGKNYAESHIDFVIRNPTISADNKIVFKDGKWFL